MMFFMSKYSKNIDFFCFNKKIFLMFFRRFYNALEIFADFFNFFFHNFLSLYVVMMLFMSKYSKNIDFFCFNKKNFFDVFLGVLKCSRNFCYFFFFFFFFFEFICRYDAFYVKI